MTSTVSTILLLVAFSVGSYGISIAGLENSPQRQLLRPDVGYNGRDQYLSPQYSFAYSVKDDLTGDEKEHHEQRDGDFVEGGYSLVEPDGNVRIVKYTADATHGFNAIVSRTPYNNPQFNLGLFDTPSGLQRFNTINEQQQQQQQQRSPLFKPQPQLRRPYYVDDSHRYGVNQRTNFALAHQPVAGESSVVAVGHAPVAVTRLEHHPVVAVAQTPIATTHVEHHPIAFVH